MNRLSRVSSRRARWRARSTAAPLVPAALSRTALVAFVLSLWLLGCGDTDAPGHGPRAAGSTPAALAPASAPAPNYSPFVVDLPPGSAAALPFHLISFKDVGMSLPDDAARQVAYESLAEALSLELAGLGAELGAPMTPSVRHDQRIADPMAHLACEGGHLYVDVWRSGAEGPYGFSLWSGCGEDDRFAYNERVAADDDTPESAMDPLAEQIAQSLAGALRRRCFQLAC